ncbi:DUF4296 domain-containing protein [Flavobacterium sp. TMP13]|uniref:DUF4296 domain-containing protein n=1 Tax=Flavobacterium sp. TMP13 TaxID=3425950 RepID=UPI003D778C1B
MKKILVVVSMVLLMVSCKEEVVAKPEKLIDKKIMTNILYDMALLEAIKYQYPYVVDSNQVNTPKYIYKKYKIDSLQFAQNNMYYASHFSQYKDIFTEVQNRIKTQDSIVNKRIFPNRKKDSIRENTKKAKKQEKAEALPAVRVNEDSINKSIKKTRHKLRAIE